MHIRLGLGTASYAASLINAVTLAKRGSTGTMPAVQPHPCRSACPVLWKQQKQFVSKRFMLSARSPAPPHICERQLFARAAKPCKVERSTEAWKNRLQSRPANTHIPSVTATSVWPDLAAMLRCADLYVPLLMLSVLMCSPFPINCASCQWSILYLDAAPFAVTHVLRDFCVELVMVLPYTKV